MNWAEILEEKNALIAKLEEQLAEALANRVETKEVLENALDSEEASGDAILVELEKANKLIKWVYDKLKSPIELTADNKLPAVRAARERLGKYLEKK